MLVSHRLHISFGLLLIAVVAWEIGFMQALSANTAAASTHIDSVVELFTSQGCSSCPPADRLLSQIARKPNVVAISFPIDYWDFIGWKDTLASPNFTTRQKDYAAAHGDDRVYTPQAIIDGLVAAVGSNEKQIKQAISTNKGRRGALTVPMHLAESGDLLRIDVGPGPDIAASLYVLRVVRSKTVVIGRGENSGRSVTYTNVVRAMQKIGDWHGAAHSYKMTELKGAGEGYIAILQEGPEDRPGVILAAAKSVGF